MESLYIVEEKARTFCPKCKSELVYEQSYNNLDLIMYCNFVVIKALLKIVIG